MVLTPRDIDVLRAHIDKVDGFDPTVREIGERLGVTAPTVQTHIDKLVREGALARRGYQRRITDLGWAVLGKRVAA